MQIKSSSNKNIRKEFKNLRKELLDLTLRNPLLNFKSRNKTLNIINQNPLNVYKTLVLDNKRMHFAPNKKEDESKKSFAHAFISQTKEMFSSIEQDKTLKADLSPSELQKRLFYIDQQAKTMVQEQGYNILYIACGFVEWVDKKKPKQKNLAPLILIPVEIERKKAGNSFSLSWTGEDLQHNISLEAKLKEEGIKLPKFQPVSHAEGVEQYLISVNKVIRKYKDWNVVDNVALGFFSFTKFVMYNDLNPESWKDNIDLTKNELIEAIFNPKKNIYEDTFTEDEVDEKLHYKTMYQVLDADSSQIAVIENVKAGHNLVVEGPPGTGKSQTIVNLIAELIAEGKTVLFVSEKMAALEVVKSRLDNVGLGKFVLELHSHKTRRKKLLKELQRATNVRATKDLKLDQTLRKLENLRNQLDDYAEVIHKPLYNINLSAFELYGMKESAEDYFSKQGKILPLVRMENTEEVNLKDLDDIIISLENLSELYSTISRNNPWNYCNPKSLLPADLREIELLIKDTLESLNEFRYEISSINDLYGIRSPTTLQEYEDSIKALKLLNTNNARFIDSSILLNREWYEHPDKAFELIKLLEKYQKTAHLFDKFTDNILIADLDALIYNLEKESQKKFRLFGSNQYKEELSYLYKGPVPDTKRALNDLINIRQNIKIRQAISDNERLANRYFGHLWSKNTPISELEELAKWMDKFTYLLSNGTFSENTIDLLSKDLFVINTEKDMASYLSEGNNFYNNLKNLESKLNPRSSLIFKKETKDVSFESWESQLNKWKGQLSSLHLWSQYSNTKRACLKTPAELFVKTIEKRNIKKDEVKSLVLGNFADSLLNLVFAEETTLATFIGELHENRIKEFKDLDRKIINLNRKRIFNKLNSQIPKIFGEADNPEAKILAGEFTRKSGHLPVRNLLEKAGGTIKKIKPVFMMSPLSIAQYLDPTNPKLQFDVVIFDEASQVKPEDALGAFMRGKTAVVMGDTQQLPPTSFFDQMTDSESGEEVATALDMESILHLCKLSFPVKMLKWHYRSRHESLINISNREFYDNELLVYPSPSHNDPELGLKFKYNPDTAYHRGEGSANPKEAKDVVKEIFRHFNKYGDKKSLGVGTFSVAQKNAILEELEIERKLHPEFEPLFSDKKPERFFVKNLETIQGDERDVILISIGYGYDTEGKMSLNFGPLNQDGGERRLNVLITRAREKCVVFSNFRSHDIHLTANPPFGVKSLKSFLEYAENIQLNNVLVEEYDESPFEDAIFNFLIENGYDVSKKIGCAGFRVDLAIVDDENPGKYLLGIECDGEIYASSKVARDRDRLRDQVLSGLGWNIYHLWSTDWYRNRELAKDKLLKYIELTKYNTKANEIKSQIKAFESMKINPVTSFIIKKHEDNKNNEVNDNIEDGSVIVDAVDGSEGSDGSVIVDAVDGSEGSDGSVIVDAVDGLDNHNNINKPNYNRKDYNNSLSEESNIESKNDLDLNNNISKIKFEEENLLNEKNILNNSSNELDMDNSSNSIDVPINSQDSTDIQFSDEYIETEEDFKSEYITDEVSALKTKELDKDNNKEVNEIDKIKKIERTKETEETNEIDAIDEIDEVDGLEENIKSMEESDIVDLRKDGKPNKKSNRFLSYKESITRLSNEINEKFKHNQNKINDYSEDEYKDNFNEEIIENNIKTNSGSSNNELDLDLISKEEKSSNNTMIVENIGNNSNNKSLSRPKFKSSFDDSILKENYLKDIPENENTEEKLREDYDINYDLDDILEDESYHNSNSHNYDEENSENILNGNESQIFEDNGEELDNYFIDYKDNTVDNTIVNTVDNNSEYKSEYESYFEDEENNFDNDYIIPENNNQSEYLDNSTYSENEYIENNDYLNSSHNNESSEDIDKEGSVYYPDSKEEYDNSSYEEEYSNEKDGINYYDTAIGFDNALKKNAVVHPSNYKSNKTGVARSLDDLKNEIKYINKACKLIENPIEREEIYVIDRLHEEEYEPVITPNPEENIVITPEIHDNINNEISYDDSVHNANPNYDNSDYTENYDYNYESFDSGYIEPIQEDYIEPIQNESENKIVSDFQESAYDDYNDSIGYNESITPISHDSQRDSRFGNNSSLELNREINSDDNLDMNNHNIESDDY
ncbi:MAG: DUF4011 domain-containing protein, partial [archaeon]|nr:DUF4011 domain-containing protein [archaeon]